MKRIIIFGAGRRYYQYEDELRRNYEILGVSDNNAIELRGEVISPCSINDYTYDYVIVTPDEYNDIYDQLINMDVPKYKIQHVSTRPDIWLHSIGGNSSFSQFSEDLIVDAIFSTIGIEKPSYIDIGANHPYNQSNTALLYLRGSEGISVEPNPDSFSIIKMARINDNCLNVGVACEEGELPFYRYDDYSALNTFSEECSKRFPDGKKPEVIILPVVCLKTIIEKYCPNGFPDFCSIDIEGLDYDVLSDYDLLSDGPKVICVEVKRGEDQKFDEMLETKGYFRFCRTRANVLYINTEYRERFGL